MSSATTKPVRKVRNWGKSTAGISPNYVPLVRSVAQPSPYSVVDGVPFGSAVVSMTPVEYTSFLRGNGYSGDELSELVCKKVNQYIQDPQKAE